MIRRLAICLCLLVAVDASASKPNATVTRDDDPDAGKAWHADCAAGSARKMDHEAILAAIHAWNPNLVDITYRTTPPTALTTPSELRYPKKWYRSARTAEVVALLLLNDRGNVAGVQLVCTPGGEFDGSAKDFVMGMTFVPTMHDGAPIRGAGIQTIVYTLR